jgi:hypothetical protein
MADTSLNDLKEMQKLTASMTKDYDELLKGHGKVNKALKNEVELQKSIVSGIKDAVTAEEAIEKLKKRHLALGTKQISNNRGIVVALQMQNTIVRQYLQASSLILARETKRKEILEKVASKVDGVTGKMKDQLHHLKHELEDIPVIGKMMSNMIPFDKINGGINRMGRAFTGGFTGSFNKVLKSGGTFTKALTSGVGGGIRGLSVAAARIAPMLAGPQAIVAAIVATLALGVIRMHQIEAAAEEFRKSTGLLNSQTKDVERQISKISAETRALGISMKEVAGYAASFYNAFHGTQRASDAVLTSMAVLNANFGIAVDDQTKLNHLFQSSAHLNQEQAQYAIANTVEAAKLAKVAPTKVIADMAANSEAMYNYFHGSVEEMGAAAIQAAKMGTSITQMTSMADKLLNFETSLTDELNAGAILGKNFNLSIARSAAAAGDMPGMYEAVLDAVGNVGDITKLTKFEQDAIVQSTGMQVSELANGLHIREKFSHLDKEAQAAGIEQLKNGKKLSDINEDDLKTLVKRQKGQKEMQGQIHALGDILKGMGDVFMDSFLPMGQAVIAFVTPIVKMIAALYSGFMTPLSAAFKRVSEQVARIFGVFDSTSKSGKFLITVFNIIGSVIGGVLSVGISLFANVLEGVVDMLGGIYDIVVGLITMDMGQLGKGLNSVFDGVLKVITSIPKAIIDAIGDSFSSVKEKLMGWWDGIISWMKGGLTNLLPSSIQSLLGMGSDTATNEATDGGSVNDGVIQNGKIISTNPADTLIAAKNPSDILGKAMSMSPLGMLANGISSLMGGGSGAGVDMGPLIAEIQGLRADMAAGKIAVHMDGRKVTSGITKIAGQSAANSYVQR